MDLCALVIAPVTQCGRLRKCIYYRVPCWYLVNIYLLAEYPSSSPQHPSTGVCAGGPQDLFTFLSSTIKIYLFGLFSDEVMKHRRGQLLPFWRQISVTFLVHQKCRRVYIIFSLKLQLITVLEVLLSPLSPFALIGSFQIITAMPRTKKIN